MFEIIYHKISNNWVFLFFLLLIFLAIPSAFHALESESLRSNISKKVPPSITTELPKPEAKLIPDSKAIVLAIATIKPLPLISKPIVNAPKNKSQNKNKEFKQQSISISNFPVKGGHISSQFGLRKDPIHGQTRTHTGIDIAADSSTFVYPLGKGMVIFSGYKQGYGETVEIRHGNTVVTRYAHLEMSLIDVGREVGKDDVIALLGNTGRSTGPHLHLEVTFNGKVVNPEIYMSKDSAPE